MKNKIILPLLAIIFLSSCANKFSLTKRKYTKGYYFASSASKTSTTKENDHKNLVVKDLPSKKTNLSSPETGNEDIKEVTVATFNKPEASKTNHTVKYKQTHKAVTASADHKKDIASKPTVKPVTEKQPLANKSNASDADTNLIILVILSLFPILALIAIYLHDGKTITLNFWIDLILHFLFLYWLFALLVVLD
nr:hypothetical protein [Bacteroidota bacterium]